ncbi:unnamed protein product [Camellia sinensis]
MKKLLINPILKNVTLSSPECFFVNHLVLFLHHNIIIKTTSNIIIKTTSNITTSSSNNIRHHHQNNMQPPHFSSSSTPPVPPFSSSTPRSGMAIGVPAHHPNPSPSSFSSLNPLSFGQQYGGLPHNSVDVLNLLHRPSISPSPASAPTAPESPKIRRYTRWFSATVWTTSRQRRGSDRRRIERGKSRVRVWRDEIDGGRLVCHC